jgi:hypothetical protein
MCTLRRSVAGLMSLAFAITLGAAPASAQAPSLSGGQCTAELAPAQVQSGQTAVSVTAVLSEQVGEVTGLEAPESGITVAAPEDLPRTEMAAEERPQPINLAEGNAWTIWINTSQAAPGTYDVTFTGSEGTCQGQLTVS